VGGAQPRAGAVDEGQAASHTCNHLRYPADQTPQSLMGGRAITRPHLRSTERAAGASPPDSQRECEHGRKPPPAMRLPFTTFY
jgi:hypothetical protein